MRSLQAAAGQGGEWLYSEGGQTPEDEAFYGAAGEMMEVINELLGDIDQMHCLRAEQDAFARETNARLSTACAALGGLFRGGRKQGFWDGYPDEMQAAEDALAAAGCPA